MTRSHDWPLARPNFDIQSKKEVASSNRVLYKKLRPGQLRPLSHWCLESP